jgi:hypothetical protein
VYSIGQPTNDDHTVVRQLNTDNSLSDPDVLPWGYTNGPPAVSRSGYVAFALSPNRPEDPTTFAVRIDPHGHLRRQALGDDLAGHDGMASVTIDRAGNVRALVSRRDQSRAWVREWTVAGRLLPALKVTKIGQAANWVLMVSDLDGDCMVLSADIHPHNADFNLRARSWIGSRLGPVQFLGSMTGPYIVGGGQIEAPTWSVQLDDDGDGLLAWEVRSDNLADTLVRAQVITREGHVTGRRGLGRASWPDVALSPGGLARVTTYNDARDVPQVLVWAHR